MSHPARAPALGAGIDDKASAVWRRRNDVPKEGGRPEATA